MRVFILLFFLIIISKSFGQTYSNLFSDKEIEEIILYDIKVSEKYEEEPKLGKKKISSEIISLDKVIQTLEFTFIDFGFDLREEQKQFEYLFQKESFEYYKAQAKNQIKNNWNLKSNAAKFKNKFSNNYYNYSIPLFNKEKDIAIIYKTLFCGDLCGHGAIEIYKQFDDKWIYQATIGLWIS